MQKRSKITIIFRLITLIKPLIFFMLAAILMGLAGHIFASFITILGSYAVIHYLNLDINVALSLIFTLIITFAILRGIFRYLEQACNHFIAFKILALIRHKVFKALRKLCPAKLDGKDKGNIISIITSDIELLEVFYAHTISPFAIAFLFSTLMCIFIAQFNLILALIAALAYLTVGIIIPIIINKLYLNDDDKLRNENGNLSTFMLDSLRGLPEIIQYNQGEQMSDKINSQNDKLLKIEKKVKYRFGKNQAFTNTIILLFNLAMLITSIILYQNNLISFMEIIIPTIALISSYGPVIALANLGSSLQNTFAAANRVLDILDETPVVEEINNKNEITFDNLAADNISFAYNNEVIIKDLSLTIPKNSAIGLLGKSGSGKSTLLKLFMRFWNVQKGNIYVSNVNINEVNTTNLRNMESYMTQDTHLFCDSIKNNIKIAKLDATDEEIINACKKASLHDFITELPNGYETNVSELGESLSGGERQRIGLARAFLHNADLILLDEPTSNLDSLNESIILKSLNQEKANKTIILVSHRKSTMKIVDKTYSVENGRLS